MQLSVHVPQQTWCMWPQSSTIKDNIVCCGQNVGHLRTPVMKEAVRNRPLVRKSGLAHGLFSNYHKEDRVGKHKLSLQGLEAVECPLLQKVERELSLYCVMLCAVLPRSAGFNCECRVGPISWWEGYNVCVLQACWQDMVLMGRTIENLEKAGEKEWQTEDKALRFLVQHKNLHDFIMQQTSGFLSGSTTF